LGLRDHGAHLDILARRRVAHLERLDRRHELVEELVVDLRPGHHARGRGAVLPRVPVAGDLDPLRDGRRIRVVEDDDRRLAAELEVYALQVVGGRARDLLARRHVAGERDHAHVRVADDARAHRLAVAGDHVQDSGGKDLLGQLGHAQRGERCLLGGLEHDDVAGGERGPDLPDGHHQWVVPRRDLADDPYRLAADHGRVAAHVLAGRASLEHPGGAREEAEVVGRDRDLVASRGHRLADVLRLELRQLLGVRVQRVRELEQYLRALAGSRLQPFGQGRLCRLDRPIDVGLSALRHFGDRLARSRVEDLGASALCRVDPLAADEILVLRHRHAHQNLLLTRISLPS
jgi:ParB family chromosome partitioning protein